MATGQRVGHNSEVDLSGRGWTAAGSTQFRTAAARAADVVNVKDFGAVGDGVADDTAEIQAAIVAASRLQLDTDDWGQGEGGIVYFPRGIYRITAPLTWTDDAVWLVGEGSSNTTSLKVELASNPSTTDAIQIGSASGGTPARRSGLKNLSVYAENVNQCRDLVSIDGTTWWRLENVVLYKAGRHGLTVGGTLNGSAINVRTSYNGDSGVFIKSDSAAVGHTTTDFYHLYSHNNQKYGMLLEKAHVVNCFGPIIEFNGAAGDATQGDGIRVGTTVDAIIELNLFGAYFEANLGWDIQSGVAAAGSNFHNINVYGYFGEASSPPGKATTYGFLYGTRTTGFISGGRLSGYTAGLNRKTFSLDSTCKVTILGPFGDVNDTNQPEYRSGTSINEYTGGLVQWVNADGEAVVYGRYRVRAGGPGASKSIAIGRFAGIPNTGTWDTGDVSINPNTAQGEAIGYVCTSGGAPGSWAPLGFRPSVSGGLDVNSNPTYTSPIEPILRVTTAIGADRTITLSTTGARRGQEVRIVRTATGAFNVTVNGLKALAVNTWADFAYDGSAWVLTAYGAL